MDIDTQPAGRELDALVAEKVLGLQVVARDWPCRHDPDCWDLDALDPDDDRDDGTYFERGPVYLARPDEWPPRQETHKDIPALTYWVCGVEPVPYYSTDLAAAWYIVEQLRARGYWCQLRTPWYADGHDGYGVGFTPHETTGWNGRPDHWTQAATVPLAICRAALKAVED